MRWFWARGSRAPRRTTAPSRATSCSSNAAFRTRPRRASSRSVEAVNEAGDNPFREEPASLGATLGAERERQGLSRADIAHRLHMSPAQVEALEIGDYAHLPRGTFLRGFVRNYAKALGIAAEPLLQMLAGAVPAAPTPGIVVPTQNIRFDPLGERFSSPYVKAAVLALVAIALGFAAMYWAMYVRPRPPAL